MLVFTKPATAGTYNNATGDGQYQTLTFPAAVGGLNKRDGKADMPITDANILTNIIPYPTSCKVRGGYESYATGMSGSIETLMEWAGNSSRKFFAANGEYVYNISSSGAVGAADISGLTNARWQYVNFATSGGNFLVMVNGADAPRNYDGTTWATTPAITGPTAADLIHIWVWKSRLWFVEKNSRSAWYLPVNSIGGAATELDLGGQFQRGGYLMAGGRFSYDAGSGPDDYLVFISDQGEVLVYQGTDPSSSTTFSLVGRFIVGSPIGRRCMLQVGGDLAIITVDGIVSLIKSMPVDRSAIQAAAITNKIQDLFNEYARDYRSNFGWQGQIYPLNSYVLFNIPFSSTEYRQLVMNTETGSWCEFQNQNSVCWGMYNDRIYFGGTDGIVYVADSGAQDNGGIINFDYQGAFNNFGAKSRKKFFHLIRSLILSNGSPVILQTMNVDFSNVEPTGTLNPVAPASSTWDTAEWDDGMWGGQNSSYQWASVGQIGAWGTPRIKGALNGVTLEFNSFEIKATIGGVL